MPDDRSNAQNPLDAAADQAAQQQNIDKEGTPRDASDAGNEPDSHFGAVEDTQTGESDMQVVDVPTENELGTGDNAGLDPQREIPGGG